MRTTHLIYPISTAGKLQANPRCFCLWWDLFSHNTDLPFARIFFHHFAEWILFTIYQGETRVALVIVMKKHRLWMASCMTGWAFWQLPNQCEYLVDIYVTVTHLKTQSQNKIICIWCRSECWRCRFWFGVEFRLSMKVWVVCSWYLHSGVDIYMYVFFFGWSVQILRVIYR